MYAQLVGETTEIHPGFPGDTRPVEVVKGWRKNDFLSEI